MKSEENQTENYNKIDMKKVIKTTEAPSQV